MFNVAHIGAAAQKAQDRGKVIVILGNEVVLLDNARIKDDGRAPRLPLSDALSYDGGGLVSFAATAEPKKG